jgi:hypothetical protein
VPVQPAAVELLTDVAPVLARWGAWCLFVLAGSGLEEDFLARARSIDIGPVTIRVIALEDLMIVKVLAGRPKDLEDVAALWRLHGAAVDATRIRDTLRLLEEALAQTDLVRVFETIANGAKPD